MSSIDPQKACIIYDSKLLNDLDSYSIKDETSPRIGFKNKAGAITFERLIDNTRNMLNIFITAEETNVKGILPATDYAKPPINVSEDRPLTRAQFEAEELAAQDAEQWLSDIWFPIFITPNDSSPYLTTKITTKSFVVPDNSLGCENAISFAVKDHFKNWRVTTGDPKMSCDWIINRPLAPLKVEYGVLCWFKRINDYTADRKFSLTYIPHNTKIKSIRTLSYTKDAREPGLADPPVFSTRTYTITPTDTLLKIDDDTLFIVDKLITDLGKIDSNTISFDNTKTEYFSISEFINQAYPVVPNETPADLETRRKKALNSISFNLILPKTPPTLLGSNIVLHIPRGDTFSYFTDPIQKDTFLADGIPSDSYISACLFPFYEEIYNALTIGIGKYRIDPVVVDANSIITEDSKTTPLTMYGSMNSAQVRWLKKIAHILATHPQIDRTTISILSGDAVQTIILDSLKALDIDKGLVLTSIATEITKVRECIAKIVYEFRDLSSDLKSKTLNYQAIQSQADLCTALINKYGCSLLIDNETTLRYKPTLERQHIKVNQDIMTHVKRTETRPVIYNNFEAKIGNLKAYSLIKSQPGSTPALATSFVLTDTRLSAIRDPKNVVQIPLWDVRKYDYITNNDIVKREFSAGQDLSVLVTNQNSETIIDLSAGTITPYDLDPHNIVGIGQDLGDLDSNDALGARLDVLWEKISGPDCLVFSDANADVIRTNQGMIQLTTSTGRYLTSSDAKPRIYIKASGTYVLRLKVSSALGIFYSTMKIYATDIKTPGAEIPPRRPAKKVTMNPPGAQIVICPNLREFAIGEQGIFWPSKSDLSVHTKINQIDDVSSFGNALRKYQFPVKRTDTGLLERLTNVLLDLKYTPENSVIKIGHITLRHMMRTYEEEGVDVSLGCETFFQSVVDNKGFVLDAGTTASFTLIKSALTNVPGQIKEDPITFAYPERVTTDYARVRPYGGFDWNIDNPLPGVIAPVPAPKKVRDVLGVEIPFFNANQVLPSVLGAPMDSPLMTTDYGDLKADNRPFHLCHLVRVPITGTIEFSKGVFVPGTGWFNYDTTSMEPRYIAAPGDSTQKNTTSVIKFLPGRRESVILQGMGMFNLDSPTTSKDLSTQIYKSTISFSVASEIRDAQEYDDVAQIESIDVDDHDVNSGYRNLGGYSSRSATYNHEDEFRVEPSFESEIVDFAEYCNQNSSVSSSSFVKYEVTNRGIPKIKDGLGVRFIKTLSQANIQDISVQINFLNYVNTKNLIVWLDVIPCATVGQALARVATKNTAGPIDRFKYVKSGIPNSYFSKDHLTSTDELNLLPSGLIRDYLTDLSNMNSHPTDRGVYRLYLLNQEHVQSNIFNTSIRFSDSAHANSKPSNTNYSYHAQINPYEEQQTESEIIQLLPTVIPPGYTDKEAKALSQVMNTNHMHMVNNRFVKFQGLPLFLTTITDAGGGENTLNWGGTQFVLNIAVVGPSDLMTPLDNIVGMEQLVGLSTASSKRGCNSLNNSACSWEIIIKTDQDTGSGLENRDTLGQIDYREKASFPGYSFMANFKDKEYLIPPINRASSSESYFAANPCKFPRESLNLPPFSPRPFDMLAAILIIPAANLVEAIGLAESVDSQGANITRQIYDYFLELRRQAAFEVVSNALYIPDYQRYPFGASDKALIEISKDGHIWYKLEASIFKYKESLIAKENRYSYQRLHMMNLRHLSVFEFSVIDSFEAMGLLENGKYIYLGPDEGVPDLEAAKKLTRKLIEDDLKTAIADREALVLKKNTEELIKIDAKISRYKKTLDSIGIEISPMDTIIYRPPTT